MRRKDGGDERSDVEKHRDEEETFESLGERGDDVQPGGEGGGGASGDETFDVDALRELEDDDE